MTDPRAASSRQAWIGLLALTAVLLASAAVGFIAYRLLLRPTSVHATLAAPIKPPADARGTEVPPEGTRTPPARVPERLPEIRLPGIDGAIHGLTDWKDRPLVINFWATWCDPCRREIPLLKTLRHERAADRLEIVGIAVDYPDEVRKYAQAHGIDYPVLVGDQGGLEAVNAFGMETVLPFSVFSDRRGRIVTLKVGELHRDEAELILDRVRAVDAGTLTLPAARDQISEGIRQLRTSHASE